MQSTPRPWKSLESPVCLLVDGQPLAYRAYYGIRTPLHSRAGEDTRVLYGVTRAVLGLIRGAWSLAAERGTVRGSRPDLRVGVVFDGPGGCEWRRRLIEDAQAAAQESLSREKSRRRDDAVGETLETVAQAHALRRAENAAESLRSFPDYKSTRSAPPDELTAGITHLKDMLAALGIPVLQAGGDGEQVPPSAVDHGVDAVAALGEGRAESQLAAGPHVWQGEADDLIAALSAGACHGRGWQVLVVSPDKDFQQLIHGNLDDVARLGGTITQLLPGRRGKKQRKASAAGSSGGEFGLAPHFEGLAQPITEQSFRDAFDGVEPCRFGDILALAGDASDGVPGVPGIGPKRAQSLIAAHGSLDNVLAEAAAAVTGARSRSEGEGGTKPAGKGAAVVSPKLWGTIHLHAARARLCYDLVRLTPPPTTDLAAQGGGVFADGVSTATDRVALGADALRLRGVDSARLELLLDRFGVKGLAPDLQAFEACSPSS